MDMSDLPVMILTGHPNAYRIPLRFSFTLRSFAPFDHIPAGLYPILLKRTLTVTRTTYSYSRQGPVIRSLDKIGRSRLCKCSNVMCSANVVKKPRLYVHLLNCGSDQFPVLIKNAGVVRTLRPIRKQTVDDKSLCFSRPGTP